MSGKPLTIALVTSTFLPSLGGAEMFLHNTAVRLRAYGFRPIVIIPASYALQLRRSGWELPYEIVSLPPKLLSLFARWPEAGMFAAALYYLWLQKRYNFDVWHGTIAYPFGVSLIRFARTRRPIPHLVRCAGEDIQTVPEIGYGMRLDGRVDRLIRKWLPQADMLVAISDSIAEEYRALGVAEERITLIPNGVDLTRFQVEVNKLAVRRKYGLPESAFAFISIGRNHPKKNFDTLVKAVAVLKERTDRDFILVLVGSGVKDLQPTVQRLGLVDLVFLFDGIGKYPPVMSVPEVPSGELIALYKSADAFVFPSIVESLGNVLLEAMAAGLPVITSWAPGCVDVVRRGKDALLVDPRDRVALADSMLAVMEDLALRLDLAARSSRRAQDFSWDSVIERYIGLYEWLATDARTRGRA